MQTRKESNEVQMHVQKRFVICDGFFHGIWQHDAQNIVILDLHTVYIVFLIDIMVLSLSFNHF